MLHKRFKPAKCKTALKLAVSRIKLLKNKREAQVKQLKRELAQLLESGQDQTARIRVEHVVREEKTMAAYDLIEIYCELITARLPIIESQKNCPIDLKEAVSSVIFASPRCADIPELMDVRKHFTAKYGKEFVAAAVELRPDCGVSRLLVEKLSAKAPDGPTKIKIMSAIAEEHNVKWDPKSLVEKEMKPPDDLLDGPNTFEQARKMHAEPRNFQKPPSSIDELPANSGASSKHYEKHDAPVNSYGSKIRSSPHSQNIFSAAVDASKAMPSGTSHPDTRPLGTASESMESRHSFAAGQDSFSGGRQSWKMEFKDATTAAQAAAESAERASMAARAAAELSSQGRLTRQHSTESNNSSVFRSIDEEVQNYVSSRLQGEHIAKDPVHNSTHRSNSGMHHKGSSENQQDDLAGLAERFNNLKSSNNPTHSVSSKSSSSFVGDHPQVSDFQMADRHSRKTSLELEKSDLLGEASMKRESSESEEEFVDDTYNGRRSEDVGYFEEASIRKRSTSLSPHSHSQIPSVDLDIASSFSQQKSSEEVFEEPFIYDEEKIQKNIEETNSYDNVGVVFDDSGSDDDIYKVDAEGQHNGLDSSSYFLSESRKSSHLLANTSTKSPRLNMEESHGKFSSEVPFASQWHSKTVFSEGLTTDTVSSQADDLLQVNFDESDGPGSDSEEERNKSELVGRMQTCTFPHKDIAYSNNPGTPKSSHFIISSLAEKENAESNKKTWMQPSSVDLGVEVHSPRNQGIEVGDETDGKLDWSSFHNNQTSHRLSKSLSKSNEEENTHAASFSSVKDDVQGIQSQNTSEDTKTVKESSLESGTELNFGNLTGGLRNKVYKHPPYRRNPLEKHSVPKPVEDNCTRIDPSPSSLKVDTDSGAHNQMVHQKLNKNSSSGSHFHYSDARDESDEECPQQTLYSSQEPYIQKTKTEMNKKSGLSSYFDSDNSDFEEDLPKQAVTSRIHAGTAFSRRTKASPSNYERNSYLKSKVPPESSLTTDSVAEKKSSSVSSYATETPGMASSQTSSYNWGTSKQYSSPEQDKPKPISQSKKTVRQRSSSRSSYTSNIQQNPSSQSKNFEQHRLAESSKPLLESKRSSHEENLKASARGQPSNPPPRKSASGGAESTETSNSHADSPSRENSFNKASHVHPKLPDYDTLTAHLLSLRQNHQ